MADNSTKKFDIQQSGDFTIKLTDDQLSDTAMEARRRINSAEWTTSIDNNKSTRFLSKELTNLEGIVDFVRDVVSNNNNNNRDECDLTMPRDNGEKKHFRPVITELPERASLPLLRDLYNPGKSFAAGGQGTLSYASDLVLKRTVALKSLRKELLSKPEMIKSFMTEAMVTAQLIHPSIVSIYSLLRDEEDGVHLTMQLVRGTTLQERMAQMTAPAMQKNITRRVFLRKLKKRLEIFLRICEPISYAHSKGIIHCDLKPENIMLGKYGQLYVMDWGIARKIRDDNGNLIPEDQRDKNLDGTPRYLPPEALAGKPRDERADIYALGLILFNICTLRNCYEGNDQQEILGNIRDGIRNPVVHRFGKPLSNDLIAVIEKAIARNPEDRYQSVSQLAEDVQRIMLDEEVNARPDSLPSRILRFIRHHSRAFVVSALIIWLVSLIISGNALKESLSLSERRVQQLHNAKILEKVDGMVFQSAMKLHGRFIALSENLKIVADTAMFLIHRKTQVEGDDIAELISGSTDEWKDGHLGFLNSERNAYVDFSHFTYHIPGNDKASEIISTLDTYRPALPLLRKVVLNSGEKQDANLTDRLDNTHLAKQNFLIMWAYIALEENGLFMIYPANSNLGGDYDGRKTSWYMDAKKHFADGKPRWGEPYRDAISDKTVVTCTIPLTDADKKFIGVCAMDLDLDAMAKIIFTPNAAVEPYLMGQFLFTANGQLLHHRRYRNLDNVQTTVGSKNIFYEICSKQSNSDMGHFMMHDGKLSCHYAYLKHLDMYLVNLCNFTLLAPEQSESVESEPQE